MKYLAAPFKLLHRVFGAIIITISVSTLALLVTAGVLGLVALALGFLLGFIVWFGMLLIFAGVGLGLLALARVFDQDYLQGKNNIAKTVMDTVQNKAGDLRDIAKEHL